MVQTLSGLKVLTPWQHGEELDDVLLLPLHALTLEHRNRNTLCGHPFREAKRGL